MSAIDRDDAILARLSHLPSPTPDPARAARVIEQCHRQLARRQRRRLHRVLRLPRIPEPTVVRGFALMHVVALVHRVLRWRGSYSKSGG